MAEVLAVRVGKPRLRLHHGWCGHHGRGRLGWLRQKLADALPFRLDGFAVDLALILVLLLGLGMVVFPFSFGDARLAARAGAVSFLRRQAEDLLSEARESHAGGMSVCDFLCQHRIACHLVPVNLEQEHQLSISVRHAGPAILMTYILQAFLLQDCKQEAGHRIVVVGHGGDGG